MARLLNKTALANTSHAIHMLDLKMSKKSKRMSRYPRCTKGTTLGFRRNRLSSCRRSQVVTPLSAWLSPKLTIYGVSQRDCRGSWCLKLRMRMIVTRSCFKISWTPNPIQTTKTSSTSAALNSRRRPPQKLRSSSTDRPRTLNFPALGLSLLE